MKTVKITLAVVVISAITATIIWGFMSLSKSDEIQLPKNLFINKIELKIDSLKKITESSFCDKYHEEIKYYIEDDYRNKRLGNTQKENEQWKKNLSSQLYAAYTAKFIMQAFYVFKGSEWENQKLNFIRKEYQALQLEGIKSGFLETNSNNDIKFNEIKNILIKYDEITGFINSSKIITCNVYSLDAEFPISFVQNQISISINYINNNLENDYVNNCERLKIELNAIPQILFKEHVKYLDNKITAFSEQYKIYKTYIDYKNNLYTPLLYQINNLNHDFYPNTDEEYERLRNKWQADDTNAYYYF